MNPKKQLILKAALKNCLTFFVIWLAILAEAWVETDGQLYLKGIVLAFVILQIVGLAFTFRYKRKLDRNPIQ